MADPNTIANWGDNFGPNSVQSLGAGTNFLSSESVLVCAAPSEFVDATANPVSNFIPIGLVENAAVQQSKQLQQLFEIGSRKPFFVPGRVNISSNLSRVLFNGPSLLKALYKFNNAGSMANYAQGEEALGYDGAAAAGGITTTDGNSTYAGDFYINLASEFFNAPIGLAFLMRDMEQEAYAGFHLGGCFIQGHQFSMAAQQTVLLENVSLRATTVTPISATMIGGKEEAQDTGE